MDAIEWPPTFDGAYTPPLQEEHWDIRAETMSPQDREAVVLSKLRRQLRYAYENSEFYRELWSDAPVDPANIRSLDDLRRLPILTKDDLRREQEAHPPFGRYLCIPEGHITRIQGTSGTTGNPTIFGIGRDDWDRIAEAHARILWGAGLRPDDTVIIAAVFSAYIGSWGALLGAERLGARCFPFGAGAPQQTERAVDWIAMLKPTALYGTPSYALYLASTARQMGVDPLRDFNFRLMFFSGEPGASIPSTRKEIEETFGCCVGGPGEHGRDDALDDQLWVPPPEARDAPVDRHRLYGDGRSRHPRACAARRRRRPRLHAPGADLPAYGPLLVRRPRQVDGFPLRVRKDLPDAAGGTRRTSR